MIIYILILIQRISTLEDKHSVLLLYLLKAELNPNYNLGLCAASTISLIQFAQLFLHYIFLNRFLNNFNISTLYILMNFV